MSCHFDNVWFIMDFNDNTKNANMKNNQLTSNPTVYGIISASPLFKVAFPDAKVFIGIDLASEKDKSVTRIVSINDGVTVIDDSFNVSMSKA